MMRHQCQAAGCDDEDCCQERQATLQGAEGRHHCSRDGRRLRGIL